jgi:hypothetical protein
MARYSKASKILLAIFLFTGAYISVVKLYQSNKTSSYLDFYAQEEAEARKIFSKQPPNVIPGLNLNQDRIKMLVIEGGGARGLFAIHILDYLEKKTGRPISQLYDVMGGDIDWFSTHQFAIRAQRECG